MRKLVRKLFGATRLPGAGRRQRSRGPQSDGEENHKSVSLLVTDLVMPGGLSGLELARRLQAKQPRLKVVFISGYSAEIAGRELQLNSGENFIQKPFTTEQLLTTLRRSLDG